MGLFKLPVEVAGKDLERMKRQEWNLLVKSRCWIPIHNNAMTENLLRTQIGNIIMTYLLVESRVDCNAHVDTSGLNSIV